MVAPTLAELQPMLLTERKTLPATGQWLWEIKYDGYRALASTGQVQLKTKGGADATRWFPELIDTLSALPEGNIIDGEVCVLDDLGRSDFNLLHARALRRGWHAGANPVVYCVFDLLVGGGKDLRGLPVEKRKAALRKLLAGERPSLLYVQDVENGVWLYEAVLGLHLEGMVGKRTGSVYRAGERSIDWIKVKRPGAVPAKRFRR
ncbi:hypothetical protein [Cupriavidus taiwanensis]|uniref:ATP-dependent DNA ligase n=1 Tax=Cupriavidus taiwanensis TaxID=164546 RepID=UPI000E1029D5|nr:hypothetical protein [Cupriavidus taiwanensis]SOY56884.1 conserved hypothetical protein [Cupriavidus taiwanensis]SOY90833.1 conserved hypothetical protein [Cupriavidus taiwanensis]SOZ63632.1 conserved hypothetical protein [Cupriavidus taiwanensis]SOZ82638.1 conserved hypothetical protein [Cupriavidus taiwanensis]SOZ84469.1 conserved hypothetical protein [Cupriavidus taiwanensis]